MADGSITFSTEFDNKKLEKELEKAKKNIGKLEGDVADLQEKLDKTKSSSVLSAAELDAEKAKLQELKNKLSEIRAVAADNSLSPDVRAEAKAQISDAQMALADHRERVRLLQNEYNKLLNKIDRYTEKLEQQTVQLDNQKQAVGEMIQELNRAQSMAPIKDAVKETGKRIDKLGDRITRLIKRVFIFSLFTSALREIRGWVGKVISTNKEATASIARLKGALLVLAQPLINVVIPAFTLLIDILTKVVDVAAHILSTMLATTYDQSKEAAKALYDETEALDKTGDAAKKAGKSLASFDEINKLGDNKPSSKSQDIKPDFEAGKEKGWLNEVLGDVAGMVAAALMLAGIALIAIGAARGSLILVVAGLALLIAGYVIADDTGELQSWVDALGLNNVQEFVAVALILGGIAMVAIGAALGNIRLVIAGLLLIGLTVVYAERSGMLDDWAKTLGLNRAASYVTAALLIGGMVLIVLGAILKNYLMVIAGLGLLAAGIYIGKKSGVFNDWWEALKLSGAARYVTAALLIGGMVLIVLGAILKNYLMVIAGLGLLAAGIYVGMETGTFQSWWEVLQLPEVAGWVTAVLLLGGIALTVFGIVLKNIPMFLGGLAMLFAGIKYGEETGTFDNWWDTLGLKHADTWVTAALLIGGIGLVVIGIVTANVLMLFGGLALLAVGAVYGTETGTFDNWWDTLGLDKVSGYVSTALLLGGIALVAIGAATLNPLLVIAGLGLLGAGVAVGLSGKSSRGSGGFSANVRGGGFSEQRASAVMASAPRLATGAVIPPNREFMAVLGDQKSGTNIEAPVAEIEAAVARGIQRAGGAGGGDHTVILEVDRQVLGRVTFRASQAESKRIGVELVEV